MKLQNHPYLINSQAVAIFSDKSLANSDKLDSELTKFTKAFQQKYLLTVEGTSLLLNEYKASMAHLSGKEINQEVHERVEKQIGEKLKIQMKNLQRMKTIIEKSIVNFIVA